MSRSIADILAVASDPANVRETTARIVVDEAQHQTLKARHAKADAELQRLLNAHGDEVTPPDSLRVKAEEVRALEDEMDAAEFVFTFRAIASRDWQALLAKHPPTKQQLASGLPANMDTFKPAAIAASCIEPEMSVADATMLQERLPDDRFERVWMACLAANRGTEDVNPKSVLAGIILSRSVPSVTTAASEESPGPSSSDE